MNVKGKYKRLNHITFNLIDLLCLIISFIFSYYIKFKNLNLFSKAEWTLLLAIMCIINIICSIIQRTYIGILKRRYYEQFQKELALVLSQLSIVCFLLFLLKAGEIFSRQMVFTTYISYFIVSQIIKYIRKKFLTGEFSFSKKETKTVFRKNTDEWDFKCIDNRSELQKLTNKFIKRSFDIVFGVIGCIILIPLSVFIFIINKLSKDDDGPLFYVQEKKKKNGTRFKMIKYRSMVIDADEKLERFLEENEDVRREFKMYRKIKNDPRVTKVGSFLRRTSLDEMPQFVNVLIGDMSLVGPRPYLPGELKDMGKYYNIIIQYKPGITGLWQISGRSEATFEERLDMDLNYHKNNSIFGDLEILIKTFLKVLKKEGAV